jgi:uncharacterized membrane protein
MPSIAQTSRAIAASPKLANVKNRPAVVVVTVALFALGGLTLLLALVVAVMFVYTWLTDGIGA